MVNRNYAKRILTLLLSVILVLSITTGLSASETGNAIILSSNPQYIVLGDSLHIKTAFPETIETNAATLTYTFDGDKFEYADYLPADGTTVLDTRTETGSVKIILMIMGYDAKELGEVILQTRADAGLRREKQQISLTLDYVFKASTRDESKDTRTIEDYILIRTFGGGQPEVEGDTDGNNIVDLVDVSYLIDWLGKDRTHPAWEDLFMWYDFNENGEIDMQDVAYLIRLINPEIIQPSKDSLAALIAQAELLAEEAYTPESWSAFVQALDAAKAVLEDDYAQQQEIDDAGLHLQSAMEALVENGGEGIPVEHIKINASGLFTLSIKKTAQITATVLPEDAADRSVTWISTNTNIFTVDGDGNITPHKQGTATLTAQSANGLKSTIIVRITA